MTQQAPIVKKTSPSRGFALVVVLSILTLLLILAVSFISSTGNERAASAGFSSLVSTRQLADMAVGLVQGQINQAATQGPTVAWASQPGMVRTFNNSNGAMIKAYKLYSAATMITDTVSQLEDLLDGLPNDWASNPAVWTDLNAPVEINGTKTYPILDPSSLDLPENERPEAFKITSAPGVTGTSYQTAPMPVRWLYVLGNGAMVAPVTTGGNTVTIPGATGASGTNPIVGRVAFWTDDDTCKVNVNTASEGSYWDMPRANTMNPNGTGGDQYEIDFSSYQPAQKEFQRYAGHPATTSLSAVFPGLTREKIDALVPRVQDGGSKAGTAFATGTIPLDTDRLYANIDELVFKPDRKENAAGLTKTQIEQAKFFLTARSRAPETNLFNLPRISMWPIYTLGVNGTPNTARTTPFDRLIAFCASTGTVGGSNYRPYIFQRQNAYSAIDDISLDRNNKLLSYLAYLTEQPAPGFGGRLSAKYPDDRDQILTEIFDYIRCVDLQDDALSPNYRFTKPISSNTSVGMFFAQAGYGWVVPSQRGSGDTATMGFGRCYTISELSLVFICNADGAGFLINGNKPTLAQCSGSQSIKDANDAAIDSNKLTNKVLNGTPLKGEPFLNVGYGTSKTGIGNQHFDWDDSTKIDAFPQWKGNGVCDFEPWDDLNENGQYDPGEPFYDAVGDGVYRGEAHEPLHDWGRTNSARPAWPSTTTWPQHAVWTAAQWDAFVATRNVNSEQNGRYDTAEKYIQAMILPEFFSPMQGLIAMGSDMQMTISGLETLKINDQHNDQQLFPAIADPAIITSAGGVNETSRMGGCPTYRFFGFGRGSPARGNLAGDTGKTLYPFIGIPIKISAPVTGDAMTFSGGTLTVNLYAGASGSATQLIQTIPITLPASTNFPVPEIVPDGVPFNDPSVTVLTDSNSTTPENWWAYSVTGAVSGKPGRLNYIGARVFDHNFGHYKAGIFIRPEYDTVRSMLPPHGDYRLIAASKEVSPDAFRSHPLYDSPASPRMAACLYGSNVSFRPKTIPGNDVGGKYISSVTYDQDSIPDIPTGATQTPESTGDFDNGIAQSSDGAYVNKPDEGDVATAVPSSTRYTDYPYYRLYSNLNAFTPVGITFFSPNRQIPSPGMLGSLSTGVKSGTPWRTLLFRPQASHPAYSTTAPDHLFMDLFWMPIVEPYALSDRFSTSGKINMNYQILPFTYIERSTGMRAVLKSERLAAIPITLGLKYKGGGHTGDISKEPIRLEIDRTATLSQFQSRFDNGNIFKSASEICDIHILPNGKSVADMTGTFWQSYALTGDNLRERIYTTLYPRLTTKSNTFTVHVRVQALKTTPGSAAGTWTEGKDAILSEYRGSTSLERFIDANNPEIPDYAYNPVAIPTLDPLDKFYRWRVIENRQFAP